MAILTFPRTATVAVPGDSITASSPGYFNYLVANVTEIATGPTSSLRAPASLIASGARNTPTFLNFGHAGDVISDIIAREAAIIAANPTVILIQCGRNDLFTGVPVPTVQANANTLMSDFKAALPGVILGWVGILSNGDESAVSAYNSVIASYDAALQAACTAQGATFIEISTQRIAWEVINNPTNQTNGYLTTDGTHPTDGSTLFNGQRIMAGFISSNISVTR